MYKKSSIFEIDENKPNILVSIGAMKPCEYTHYQGSQQYIVDKLLDSYNIIYLSNAGDEPNSYINGNGKYYKDELLRKKDDPDYVSKNNVMMENKLHEAFDDGLVFDYVILGTDAFYKIPLAAYCAKSVNLRLHNKHNEYYDNVTGNDLEDIKTVTDYMMQNWDRKLSPIAFSTDRQSIGFKTIKFLYDNNRIKNEVISFIIDPSFYTPFFIEHGIPLRTLYFENDTRGTRNFEKWPIAQFQHILYTKKYLDTSYKMPVKDQNLCFAGTILQSKGDRVYLWEKFLRDVKSDDCTYWIPLRKNGINTKKVTSKAYDKNLNVALEHFGDEVVNSIRDSKHYGGEIIPLEHEVYIKRFKYGMVLRCVSCEDSLNFKPLLYTYRGVLPLLDPLYDPDYLMIPKHIQEKIVVEDAADIDKKIEYFNLNEDKRLNILSELSEIFMIDDFVNNEEETVKKFIQQLMPEYE